MKNPRKPTRAQKEIISNNRLNPDNWLVIKEDETYLYLISKDLKRKRSVNKNTKKVKR